MVNNEFDAQWSKLFYAEYKKKDASLGLTDIKKSYRFT